MRKMYEKVVKHMTYLPKYKFIGVPIAIAGETGQLTTINCLVDLYLVNEMIIPSSTYWNISIGVHKGDIEKNTRVPVTWKILGKFSLIAILFTIGYTYIVIY